MSESLQWGNSLVTLNFEWSDDSFVALSGLSGRNVNAEFSHRVPLVELLAAGRGTGHSICNRRLVQTSLGESLRYVSSHSEHRENGEALSIVMRSAEFGIGANYEVFLPLGTAMFRSRVTITNTAESPLVLESVTSFNAAFGRNASVLTDGDLSQWDLLECHNDWLGEGRWDRRNCREILPYLNANMVGRQPQGAHSVISEGTFSTGTSSPLGFLESRRQKMSWGFQVENNGAWRWEIGDGLDDGYLSLSGPTYRDHNWSKVLKRGEEFTSVPASAVVGDSLQDVSEQLTRYRRSMSLLSDEERRPKVAFNDYMNTLNGDPTTEKLLPLIDSAASSGAEIFCIDCGWYDDTGDWWPSVGEWKPSTRRFPGGLGEVIDAIRSKGMIPGLWVEPEVVGVKSPVADELPDSAFFLDHGQRVVEQERYLLDFRNPQVIAHMNTIIGDLVSAFGVGYFKFDYNVMPGPGTTYLSDSAGDGLLEHNRAYREWIKGLQKTYPELIIESCSSGGMRTDFAQSSLFQLLSTSDQQDFRLYPSISSAAPLTMLPEQAGNWAYPEAGMDAEEFAFAMTNTLLGHFYLSGYVNRFSSTQQKVVKEAVDLYKKSIQPVITNSVPFWPLGLPQWTDDSVALGLKTDERTFVSVWARKTEKEVFELSLPQFKGDEVSVDLIFPTPASGLKEWRKQWDVRNGVLKVYPPHGVYSAQTFAIRHI